MRKVFFIILFFIPFLTFSQTRKPITGFLGVPFGSSVEKVKTEFANKGAHFAKDSSSADYLLFTNINWQNKKNLYLFIKFVDDKAFEAALIFYNDIGGKAIENYNNVVKLVNEVYGAGQSTKKFTSPYYENDGKEAQSIAEGKADYYTFWTDATNNGVLIARISPDYYTGLVFENSVLFEQATKAGKN